MDWITYQRTGSGRRLILLLSAAINMFIGVSWVVLAHAFNPSTLEAEAGGALSLRPAWSTEGVPGQLRLHKETCLEKPNQTKLLFVTTPLNGISILRVLYSVCVCVC